MMNSSALVSVFLVSFIALVCSTPGAPATSCGLSERAEMPCICCKKDCWYTVAAAATHELGHMPGEAGEQEALATLRLIRVCMIEECGGVCTRRRPF